MEIQKAKMSNDWAKWEIIGITVYMTPQAQVETKKKEKKQQNKICRQYFTPLQMSYEG